MRVRWLLGHLRLPVTSSRKRRGTASIGPFRVADPELGMARIPALPDEPPGDCIEPVVVEGIFLSSELDADGSSRKTDRQRATTRAFQIRARQRTTPQGVFTPVAELRFGEGSPSIGSGCRTRTYPNPVWTRAVCDRAMENPDVLRGLRFHVNNLAVRRGDRIHVERPAIDPRSRPDQVSIRTTSGIDLILDICGDTGTAWHEIVAALRKRWPNFPDEMADAVLRDLMRHGIILTDLAPDDACNDPIAHLLTKIPATDPLRDRLSELRTTLLEADTNAPGSPDRMTSLTTARQLTGELAPTWRPLGADCAGETISIPSNLASRTAEAANVLWRITSHHNRLASWHDRFIHRYGTRRPVPLLDACDPVIGLGCVLDDPAPAPDHERSGVLARILSESLLSGGVEVELTEDLINALDQRGAGDRPEASAELYARVLARNSDQRDNGRYFLAVTNRAAPAGSTQARFAGLLPNPAVEPDDGYGPMSAELAFQPLSHAVASLTGHGQATPWRIPIGIRPGPDDLLPRDLALTSDGHQLSLWSTVHHRPVQPVHRNQIGHHLMPGIAAFLCVLGQDGTVSLGLWNWGPFDRAPFLPRVRYRDTILSPAHWRLPDTLVQAARDRTGWNTALSEWRATARPTLPAVIAVDDTDRQLPLDLNHEDDRELLRRYVSRGATTVVEQPGGSEAVRAVAQGPDGHHGLEVVIPLISNTKPEPAAPQLAKVRQPSNGLHLPGGAWLSLAIIAPPLTQDDILDRIAGIIGDTAPSWDRWFWLRYRTDALGPQLRIRFHGTPGTLHSELLPRFQELCGRLVAERLSSGFTVEAYAPEIERYGGPDAINAVEAVFHYDSVLCLELLRTNTDRHSRIVAAAVSTAEIARIVAGDDLSALEPYRLTGTDRKTFDRLRPLTREYAASRRLGLSEASSGTTPQSAPLSMVEPRTSADTRPESPSLSSPRSIADTLGADATWRARANALDAWRNLLPTNRIVDCASSAVHMHANRMIGDTQTERIVRALAKDLITRRTP